METTTTALMRADPEEIFDLAASVERWPEILPHYRWVRVLEIDGNRKVVEMAARRDFVPVRWTAVQTLRPSEWRIDFRHVRGPTTGMDVTWRLVPEPDGVRVIIWHGFRPGWPFVPDPLVHLVVGEFFVAAIAGRTLRCIKRLAEARSLQSAAP